MSQILTRRLEKDAHSTIKMRRMIKAYRPARNLLDTDPSILLNFIVAALLLGVVFALIQSGTVGTFVLPPFDTSKTSSIASNGTFYCGDGTGGCSGFAFGTFQQNVSQNMTTSYQFIIVLNSTQAVDQELGRNGGAFPTISARNPSGTLFAVTGFQAFNQTSGIPCSGGGCQTGIEFRGTTSSAVTNMTILFPYGSTFSNTNNNGVLNVSFSISDLNSRQVQLVFQTISSITLFGALLLLIGVGTVIIYFKNKMSG